MQIEDGCRVVARGTVCDDNGELVDDGSRLFAFTVGAEQAIAGIERAVRGHRVGERLRFVCPPEDAYGPYRPELVFETLRENLPPGVDLAPGALLAPGGGSGRFRLKVLELTERGARLDGNHPLAGRRLHFDLEIVGVSAS